MSAADLTDVVDSMPVADIIVENRHRRDLGDLDALAASIREVGLLHPVVVAASGQVVAGQRRLEAVKRLGWEHVPVRVVSHLDDASAALVAERDENTCRKDMTPTELQALGRAIEALHQPEADARRRDAGVSNLPTASGARTRATHDPRPKDWKREAVGKAVGLSGANYQRAKYIVGVAEDGETPQGDKVSEETREIARQAQAEMNETGHIFPAYTKVNEAVRKESGGGNSGPTSNGAAVKTKTFKGRKPLEGARRVVYAVHGAALPLADLNLEGADLTAEEAASWERDLSAAASAIRKFRTRLKEYSNG